MGREEDDLDDDQGKTKGPVVITVLFRVFIPVLSDINLSNHRNSLGTELWMDWCKIYAFSVAVTH